MGDRDDAGWIEFGGGLLLESVDFFTPIVDDPRRFGQIAAANALSDIYAMGGRPLTALNLVAFPKELDLEILRQILDGGIEKIQEAKATLTGGHSIQDSEPKYGVSVTGFVERERLVRNQGARPGDALVLTKPLGIGILTTAVKRDQLSEDEIEQALDAAAKLNAGASEAMHEVGVSAATDVTGYALIGHLLEMLGPAGLGATLRRGDVPVHGRTQELASGGCYPAGLANNRSYMEDRVTYDRVSADELLPLYDPQTSGGLLIAVAPDRKERLTDALARRGGEGWAIGTVEDEPGLRVVS